MESEARTEYRVVGVVGEGIHAGRPWSTPARYRATDSELEAEEARQHGNENVRIQKRTVTYTPWEDVADV